MAEGAAVDTDVILKAAAYRMADDLVGALKPKGCPAALGLTHLIAGKQLAGKRNVRDLSGAGEELNLLLNMLGRLEPDEDEIAMAADLTGAAQQNGLPLDVGEAQLAAIVARRGLPLLVTGDKRALGALAALVNIGTVCESFVGRLMCFEQVMASVARIIGESELRSRVCAEPEVDGAMRLACSCGQEEWGTAHLYDALASFSRAVREEVGDMLSDGLALAEEDSVRSH